ncbi:MAG: LysR family transcriptional regulator [Myxococcales bacterium]|nr:MAG: LysR family transcriptional regulator [Myxococcales bacterium]
MNLERLQLFLKIVDTGSVSAAGRESHVTQPAVSRSLKLLEEDIGAPLFDRQGRGLQLTAAGRALIPCARQILRESERAREQAQRAAKEGYFDLRIGAVDSIGTHILPGCLPALLREHADLKIKLWMGRTQTLLERVDRGSLDLAIVAYSGPPSERATRVGSYGLKYYGLSERFGSIAALSSEAELRDLPIVEMEALPGQPSVIRDDADAFAIAQNLSAVKALVLAGLGVGQLLPFMLTSEERARLTCAEQLIHDPDCGVYAVRSYRELSSEEARVQELLFASLSRLLARS